MSTRLDVESGETYPVPAGDTEEWSGADVQGTLDVDGTLTLVDNPDRQFDVSENPIDLPLRALNLTNMNIGLSIFLMGLMSILLGAAAFLKNYAAGIMWGFAVVALLLSGLLGIGLEIYWATVVGTVLLLIVGMIVRWMA